MVNVIDWCLSRSPLSSQLISMVMNLFECCSLQQPERVHILADRESDAHTHKREKERLDSLQKQVRVSLSRMSCGAVPVRMFSLTLYNQSHFLIQSHHCCTERETEERERVREFEHKISRQHTNCVSCALLDPPATLTHPCCFHCAGAKFESVLCVCEMFIAFKFSPLNNYTKHTRKTTLEL